MTNNLYKRLNPEKVCIEIERFEDEYKCLGVRTMEEIPKIMNQVTFYKPKGSEKYNFRIWANSKGYCEIPVDPPITDEESAFNYAEKIVREYVKKNWDR
ncbi:MAG: hypothetical protein AABX88_01185 [Nanoarchaeota archaeon]